MAIRWNIDARQGRLGRLAFAGCVAAVLFVSVASSPAQANSGKPDRSFAKNGRVIGHELPPVDIASLPGGRTIVATETTLYAYRSNGHPDRRFGEAGAVAPFAPEGRRIRVAGIAVDAHGRILIAGGAERTANTGDATSYAAVERYLPSGKLDPRFGSGGTVITDFGFPAPTRPPYIPDYAKVSLPVDVNAAGIAVDSRERIVVTGTRAATYVGTKTGSFVPVLEAFIARLESGGSQDPSFNGGAGALLLGGVASIGGPAIDANGRVTFVATRSATSEFTEASPAQVVGRLKRDGSPDPSFGKDGWRTLPDDSQFGSTFNSSVALDSKGRILLFGQEHQLAWRKGSGSTKLRHGPSVERLETNGSLDRSFGRNGVTTLPSNNGDAQLGALATMGSGQIVVAGTLRSDPKSGGEESTRLLLMRLARDGRIERRFGKSGRITANFGAKSAVEGQAVLSGNNGLVTVGGAVNHGGHPARFFLARYLLGP